METQDQRDSDRLYTATYTRLLGQLQDAKQDVYNQLWSTLSDRLRDMASLSDGLARMTPPGKH